MNYVDKTGLLYVVTKIKALLGSKAESSELDKKAPLASPTFTGTPKVPTASAGTNNTQAASTEFVTGAIATAISGVSQIKFEVVTSLPSKGTTGTIYLMAHAHGTNDSYDEYVFVNSKWEKIGNTDIDLSAYAKTTDFTAISNTEIDAMFS